MSLEKFNNAKELFEKGLNFYQKEDYDLAEKSFLQSLEIIPDRLSTVRNLISIFVKTNQIEKLNQILEKYKHLSDKKEILYGLAFSFHYKKEYEKSITICKKLITYVEFENSIQDLLASNYKKTKFFLKALRIYRKTLRKKKDYLIYYKLGCLFLDLGKIKSAYYYFTKSKNIKNDDVSTLWNLSLCLLQLKNLESGFSLYENRWKKRQNPEKKKFTEIESPKNLLEIKDKKILVWDEQGLGDTLQFSRFVIDLSKYTKKITFVVRPKLSKILSNLNENIKVIDYNSLELDNFDFQIPLCSLPKFLNIKSINDINYYQLNIKNKKKIKFEKKLNLNIGLAWSGNPDYFLDEYRSISFKNFNEIINIDDVNFFKLTQNMKANDFIEHNSFSNMFDLGDKTLYEISQILKDLDLVISVDTSIIHLAGILNINSILLLNYNSDWRWFDQKKNTIWYPSVEIIKQEKFNSWKNVFKNLKTKIEILKDNSKK